jgi:beta-N-acetylhexosaminidase
MFLVTIGGTEFYDSYYDLETFIAPGGYLLFAYNFNDGFQTIKFTSDIENWYAKNNLIKPYFSVDQEGGLVNRLRTVAAPLPSAYSVAKFLSNDKAKTLYDLAGKQIAELGIHVNLGPVIEVLTDENAAFLDTRSFGDMEKVLEYSDIFVDSMLENGVYPVVKHFPRNNADDPHYGLPVIDFDYEKIESLLFKPFRELQRNDEVGVLVAHSVLSNMFTEDAIPACLSKKIVTDVLKNQLGYDGLIFSDDLLMSALQNNGYDSISAISMAIKAGINVLMISQKEYLGFIDEIKILYETDEEIKVKVDESVKKIIDFKIDYGLIDYVDEKVSLPKAFSNEELLEYQNEKNKAFVEVYEKADEFYHTYWG